MAFKTTTDQSEIQHWIEQNNAQPAIVKGTSNDSTFGVLRLVQGEDPNLEPISWQSFFDRLETNELALRYSDEPESDIGPNATFEDLFHFVDRNIGSEPEDMTELPDVGDQDRAEDNLYSSAPADEHKRPREESGEQ